jgi:hypothetical protein
VTEKQTFGVLIRALGVLVFLDGVRTLWFALAQWALFRQVTGAMTAPSLIYGLVVVMLGSTMIRWPQWLVHVAWLEKLPTIGRME